MVRRGGGFVRLGRGRVVVSEVVFAGRRRVVVDNMLVQASGLVVVNVVL
jgi:hypothetical protein